MNTDLAIHLSEHAFELLSEQATVAGKTPAELAASVVEGIYAVGRPKAPDVAAARLRFEQCFGTIDQARPIGVANHAIDKDLAREYGAVEGSA